MRFRALKIYIILRNLFRVNHWRGFGIHSPFMYRFVREVLVKPTPIPNSKTLPLNISNYNLLKKDTLLITNLYNYLGYDKCIIVGEGRVENSTFCIAPMDCDVNTISKLIEEIEACNDECCVTILGVNKSHEKYKLCRSIFKSNSCVGVDLYRTYIFFFDSKLKKQNYKLRRNWL